MEVKVTSVSYLVEKRKGLYNTMKDYFSNSLSNSSSNSAGNSVGNESINSKRECKLLLNRVSMHLIPGAVTTMMGYGIGMKYLIECLALRQKDGLLSGKIQYDGTVRGNGIFKDIVLINDIGLTHFDSLSVFDYLYYGTRLRISHGVVECRERARLAARTVGLDGTTLIGKLNIAELRILSIAAELVGNPTLICLMDPLDGLDAGQKLDVMKILMQLSKRRSMATTIVYNVDSLNDEMLKYTDSIPLFVETKLHFIFKPLQLQEHRNIIISKDLIKQISLLTMEANKRKYHNINNVFDIDKKISYDNNSQWIIDALNKYIIKTVDDLLKIVELEKDLSKKNPVTPIVPKKKKGNRKNSDSSEEYKSIRGSNSSSYSNGDQKDSNNSMSLFKPEHTIVESEEDYSSYLPADYNASYELTPTSITKSPKPIDAAGYLPFDDENVAATLYNKTVPVRHNEFYSASRRLGEAGLPVRLRKSFVNEFMILFSRSLRYHFNNRVYMRLGFFRFIAVAILIGSLVYNDGNDISSKDVIDENGMTNSYAYNITSAVFIVVTLSLIGTAFAVPYLHSNMWQLKFEVASGLQGTVSSWCSLVLIDIPMYLVAATIISGVVFYMINIPGSSNSFFGIVLMATLAGYSLAAVCAIWIQSRQAAMIIFTAIGAFSLLFSGYFQVIPLLPLAWHWGTLVVYTRWAFEGLTVTAFQDSPSSDEFLSLYDFQDDSANYCLTWVVVWFICLQAIIVVGILPPIYKMELTSQSTIDTKLADPSVSSSYVAPNSLFEDEEKQQAAISIPSSPSFDRQPTNIAMEIYQRKESLNTLFRSDSSAGTGFNGDIEVASSSIVADALALLDDTAFQVVMAPKSTLTTLNFQRIKYIQATKGNTDIVEPRLQGISGILNPGSCCCIIDNGSDLSASLLLQILGGRCRFAGKTTGVIYANEMKLEKDTFYTNAAYVQRGDISYCSTMTVREVLYYSALLRRTDQRTCTNMGFITKYFFNTPDSDVSRLELIGKTGNVDERVNEVLQLMGLEGVADKVVGEVRSYSSTSRYNRRQFFNENSSVRFCLKKVSKTLHSKYKMLRNKVKPKTSITPAQLRCLTIGVELVNRPGLVFMEDPTGNLDWQDAEYVARVINSLAQGNRTVLCSVDKPSQGVLGMFSEVMVLGSSMLLYRGRTENAVDYFKNIGFEYNENQSPCDFLVQIAQDKGRMAAIGGKRGNILSHNDLADLNKSLAAIQTQNKPKISDDYTNGDAASSSTTTTYDLTESSISNYVSSVNHSSMRNSYNKINSVSNNDEAEDPVETITFNPLDTRNSSVGDPNSTWREFNEGTERKTLSVDLDFRQSPVSSIRSGQRSPIRNITPRNRTSSTIKTTVLPAITKVQRFPPIGPTGIVLARRGFLVLLADKSGIVKYCVQCFAAGIILGTIFWRLEDGNYGERLSLFACSYLCLNLLVVDSIDGVYGRKKCFLRESNVEASTYVSYFFADSAPMLTLAVLGSFIFAIPVYLLAELRPGGGYFSYFWIMIWTSVFCNTSLVYMLSMAIPEALVNKLVFTGVVVPLQLIFSGYLVLIPTMPDWLSWGAYICPMSYFLAGTLRSECEGNSTAVGSIDYNTISDYYSYNTNLFNSFVVLIFIGLIYRCIWLVLIRSIAVFKQREVFEQIIIVRRKARKVITAGLRWRERYASPNSDQMDMGVEDMYSELNY